MADTQTLSETSINTSELKNCLKRIKDRDKELDFRAAKTEEYLSQISTTEKSEQLFKKLLELGIPRLKESHLHKIIDIMPATQRDLKVVLQGYSLTLSNDASKKIIDAVKEFADKKSSGEHK